jgi:membrane-associated phospholipid phosphatase
MTRRAVAVTALLILATVVVFVLMAFHAARAPIQRLDEAFLRQMIGIRTGWLTGAGKVLDVMGRVYVTLPARILIVGFLVLRRRWWHVAAFVSAMVLSEVSIGLLKGLYHRARPMASLVHTSGASFPSGHAVAASVTAFAAVIALLPEGHRRYAWWAAAVFSLVMALSRAYLAAHWLSDAVAGVLLGTSIALVTALTVHVVRERRGRHRLPGPEMAP